MSNGHYNPAIRSAVLIAYRSFASLPEAEKQIVLAALVLCGTQQEAEAANDALYFGRQSETAQLKLRGVLESSQEGKS